MADFRERGGAGAHDPADGSEAETGTSGGLSPSRALREMETIFDNALVGIALARQHRIEKINARGANLLGYPAEALVGRESAMLFPSPEAYAAFFRAAHDDLCTTGVHTGEYLLVRSDGGSVVTRVSGKRLSPCDEDDGVIWVFDDVTEQKRLQEALLTSKRVAEAASRAKTQFLANISHELRTPLNGILGIAQLLLDLPADADEMQEYLGIIRQSAATLSHIVSDLLDLSGVEAGRLQVVDREFDPRAELLPLFRNYAAQAQVRPFQFSYEFDPLLPDRLIGDANRIKQILINLIGNAFKYTRKGLVSVLLGRGEAGPGELPAAAGRIRLRAVVSDTGVGIARERQDAIFEPFGIGEDYITKQYSGAGLGLTIARRLANLMGGDITVASEPGRGSVFTLTLECALPRPQEPEADHVAAAPALSGKRPLSVLLAEDEPVNRIFTVRALQKLGHVVDTAVDGREALSMLGRKPYDLILMDVQMPRLNGLDATRLIRSGNVPGIAPTIPVVALTAYAMDADRERGMEAGMDEYVTKPFEPGELVRAMERALAK